MKLKTSVKRRCRFCYFMRKGGVLYVKCKMHARHKQRQGTRVGAAKTTKYSKYKGDFSTIASLNNQFMLYDFGNKFQTSQVIFQNVGAPHDDCDVSINHVSLLGNWTNDIIENGIYHFNNETHKDDSIQRWNILNKDTKPKTWIQQFIEDNYEIS